MLIGTKISKFTGFHCVEVLAWLWVSFPTGFYVAVLDGADLLNMLLLAEFSKFTKSWLIVQTDCWFYFQFLYLFLPEMWNRSVLWIWWFCVLEYLTTTPMQIKGWLCLYLLIRFRKKELDAARIILCAPSRCPSSHARVTSAKSFFSHGEPIAVVMLSTE